MRFEVEGTTWRLYGDNNREVAWAVTSLGLV
jgi:hypothetical protein